MKDHVLCLTYDSTVRDLRFDSDDQNQDCFNFVLVFNFFSTAGIFSQKTALAKN